MRIVRPFTAILAIIAAGLTAGLLSATPALAQPPLRLPGYVTDDAGVLSSSDRAAVSSAVSRLYGERRTRLWVVYVDDFSGQNAVSWAKNTIRLSDLDDDDALLAVSTAGRSYAFMVPTGMRGITESQVRSLRRDRIEPALRSGDWKGAAIAAAQGLNVAPSSTGSTALLVALAAIAVAAVVLLLLARRRARRRRIKGLAAARRLDATDPAALATVPLDILDELSRAKVVEVDNAVRTSSNELELAVEEFGSQRTAEFTQAVNNAKAALTEAFTVRQQLDDDKPETPAQRRDLLTRVIVSAATADLELESQTEAFEQLRDLVINAPSRIEALTRLYVELTARIAPAQQRLAELNAEFGSAALASISGNAAAAQGRLQFADRNIGAARESVGGGSAGQQSRLVDGIHAAESALGQARSMLDAIDSAAGDIRHAVEHLPALLAEVRDDIKRANALLRSGSNKSASTGQLISARDAAARALDHSGGHADLQDTADPLSAFGLLTKADAELDRVLAAVAQEQADIQRLNRSYEQALFTAQSRVHAVSEFIDTRRGSIGPDARTRLSEAKRQLEAAQAKESSNLAEAIDHANSASTLAARAQSLANADVQAERRMYTRRGDANTGAVLGGIIISDMLGGGMRGGFGGGSGWSPTSFGGSDGGGFIGGGGRF
ncbi:TPM domain-containing protein [Mycobacterium sp.]|uniref:TPM domain-containing protein n=1 Tax=Mycobacterium sp. TaxID=1785 RepID=UPI003A89951B